MYTLSLESDSTFSNPMTDPFLILEPRILVSCSHLSTSYTEHYELNKLSSINKASYKYPAIFGKMIHLIFQKLLDTRSQDPVILDRFIQQAIDEN